MCFPQHRREAREQGRLDVLIRRACQGTEETPSLCGARTEWGQQEPRHQVPHGGLMRAWTLEFVKTNKQTKLGLLAWLGNFSFQLGKMTNEDGGEVNVATARLFGLSRCI